MKEKVKPSQSAPFAISDDELSVVEKKLASEWERKLTEAVQEEIDRRDKEAGWEDLRKLRELILD